MNLLDVAKTLGQDHQGVGQIGAVNSIITRADIPDAQLVSSYLLSIIEEGEAIISTDSHEFRVFNAVPAHDVDQVH